MKKYLALLMLVLIILPSFSMAQEGKGEKSKRMKPALIVIDIQNGFLPMMDKANKETAFEYINYYISLFKKNGYPVIYVYHHSKETGPHPGSAEFEFDKAITVDKDAPKVIKTYGDSFNKTELDKILKSKGVNTVFLCGLSATGCVLSTYIGAANYDYRPFLLRDALLSPNNTQTNYIEEILDAVGYEVVNTFLENAEK